MFREFDACSPIRGCIIRPESGPATNTTAMLDFDRPRESRYGEAAFHVIEIINLKAGDQNAHRRTSRHSRRSERPADQQL